ncbi:MAG: TorF family putative porin [Gammaproteobacteria bacterium]|nr:TorF family putative porin [Gammaproteobacteria bacterium]
MSVLNSSTRIQQLILSLVFWIIHVNCLADWSGSISFTTDYIDHGYSKSDGDPALLANLDYQFEFDVFTGIDVATIDFGDRRFNNRSHVEYAPYLGWFHSLSENWSITTRWQRYLFDDNIQGEDADYNLFSAALNFRDLVTLRAGFSENFYAQDAASGHYLLNIRYPLTNSIQISTAVDYNQTRQTFLYDYLGWNAGISWFHPYGVVDVRYVDSKELNKKNPDPNSWRFYPNSVDAKVVVSVSFGF